MKINIGCGTNIKEGFTNIDLIKNKGVDIVHNLNEYPYPFKDSSVEEIYARDIIEHLDDPNQFIRELWRIGKPNCKIWIRTPHFSSLYAWADLTHKRPFSYFVFDHYDITKKESTSLIEKTYVKFKVDGHLNFGKISAFGLQRIFNKFPFIYERYFSYLFPIGSVQFNLEVIKNE